MSDRTEVVISGMHVSDSAAGARLKGVKELRVSMRYCLASGTRS